MQLPREMVTEPFLEFVKMMLSLLLYFEISSYITIKRGSIDQIVLLKVESR